MPNLAFAGQLTPLRKISEAAKTMDGNVMLKMMPYKVTTRNGWVWNCAVGAVPQGRDEVIEQGNGSPPIKRGRHKDAAGASGKFSWHL